MTGRTTEPTAERASKQRRKNNHSLLIPALLSITKRNLIHQEIVNFGNNKSSSRAGFDVVTKLQVL